MVTCTPFTCSWPTCVRACVHACVLVRVFTSFTPFLQYAAYSPIERILNDPIDLKSIPLLDPEEKKKLTRYMTQQFTKGPGCKHRRAMLPKNSRFCYPKLPVFLARFQCPCFVIHVLLQESKFNFDPGLCAHTLEAPPFPPPPRLDIPAVPAIGQGQFQEISKGQSVEMTY